MFLAHIICSDPRCTEELEVSVENLDELDRCLCECGHGFVLLTVSELREPPETGVVVALPRGHPMSSRRAA